MTLVGVVHVVVVAVGVAGASHVEMVAGLALDDPPLPKDVHSLSRERDEVCQGVQFGTSSGD